MILELGVVSHNYNPSTWEQHTKLQTNLDYKAKKKKSKIKLIYSLFLFILEGITQTSLSILRSTSKMTGITVTKRLNVLELQWPKLCDCKRVVFQQF